MLPSPGLASFDYVSPTSPQEVCERMLESDGHARLFMGGTDVFVRMRDGFYHPEVLIDIKNLPGIREIEFSLRAGLRVGAAVNMNALARHPAVVEHYPLLVQALNSVASYQLRTRATLGGNLCNASPAADTAPASLVLDAQLVVYGPGGERRVPIGEFFQGPGKTGLGHGEFLLRVEFPPPPPGAAECYLKLGRNRLGDLAIAGVAALGFPDQTGSGVRFRLGLASVAPTPIRAPQAEAILADSPLTPETIESAAVAAMHAAKPISDVRSSAAYRRAMVQTLTRRAIVRVMAELQPAGNRPVEDLALIRELHE